MTIPENIGFNDIYTTLFSCLNKTRPHRRNTSRIMNGSRDKKLALAINDE
jgi:hypothetical protein